MQISIDKNAGFCSGVKRAVEMAENELRGGGPLYCLGQIVHNEEEEQRLKAMGMKVIDHRELETLRNARVLIRAHGEPPETYRTAHENNIQLIDGTCPVVLRLQNRIRVARENGKSTQAQVVIYGKPNHPEVIGLNGQIKNEAILIENPKDINKIDFTRPVCLFAQTTKNKTIYNRIIKEIENKRGQLLPGGELHFSATDSICGQVSKRDDNLREFARQNDVVIFVGGEHSSNGKYLFSVCRDENPRSHYIGGAESIKPEWFAGTLKAGITGATSTPGWLLKSVAAAISKLTQNLP
jgi:4-hydroxy-3-methylbut-2-en-1-yl diphosphate reductase